MDEIIIEDLEDEVHDKLRIGAARSGRSLEEEVHDILRKAVTETLTDPPDDLGEKHRKG